MLDRVNFVFVFSFIWFYVSGRIPNRQQEKRNKLVPCVCLLSKVPLAKANLIAKSKQSGRRLCSHMGIKKCDLIRPSLQGDLN